MTEFTNLNRETYDALNGSVRKWWGIAFGDTCDKGARDCPLCDLYRLLYRLNNLVNFVPRCLGCPVKDKTGYSGCEESPYDDWVAHSGSSPYGREWGGTEYEREAQKSAREFYYWLLALRDEYREQLDASRLVGMPAEHAAPYEGVIAVDEADEDDRLDLINSPITTEILESNISMRPITQSQFDNLPVKGGVRQCPSGYDYTDVSFGGVPAKVDAPAIVDGRFFEKGHAFIGGKID